MFLAHAKQYSPVQSHGVCQSYDVPGSPQPAVPMHLEAQIVSKYNHRLFCASKPQGLDAFTISNRFNLAGNI